MTERNSTELGLVTKKRKNSTIKASRHKRIILKTLGWCSTNTNNSANQIKILNNLGNVCNAQTSMGAINRNISGCILCF